MPLPPLEPRCRRTNPTLTVPGSLDIDPSSRSSQCQYASCPRNAGRFGSNTTRPDLNWVNSYPVTSIRYGIRDFAPALWGPGQHPELAVSGPNVGPNLWLAVPFSGTVGAACYAAHDARIPAIAFSGASEGTLAWDVSPVPDRARVYAQLAAFITDVVASSGKPYLPDDVWLNVNFPRVTEECASFDDFKFVLSRINSGLTSPRDVDWCGSTRLPHELFVSNTRGCYVSISPGDASDKTTVNDERQAVVLDKLRHILTCLP